MDPRLHSSNENQSMTKFSNRNLGNQPSSDEPISNSFSVVEDNNYRDDCEFADVILKYIDEMLMEEEMEEQTHMLQESLDFQSKERSFYEVLGQKYPPSPSQDSAAKGQYCERQLDNSCSNVNINLESTTSGSDGCRHPINVVDPSWLNTHTDYDIYFKMGFDDASKFLPDVSLGNNDVLVQNPKEGEINNRRFEGRGTKNRHPEENECSEERCKKLAAVYTESNNVPIEEFDDVLLYTVGERGKKFEAHRTDLVTARSKNRLQKKASSGSKGRLLVKKQNMKKEEIDLTSLLINCAQFVAAGDHNNANEFLKQIRQHSSPFGDGTQRLAHYFADGLETRLAGNGSQMQKSLLNKINTASDYLRAYYTCLASCPFHRVSIFVSNMLITSKSEKAMRVHVIDFGILYGFHWPSFIQILSEREGGPPKLRITGIEFPQPGFRPAERTEETGRRLARYAKTFNVPFEFHAIAQKWETIKIEDLKIEKGEFVAVNCLYRAQNIPDEAGVEESSRTMVLNLIRKINPDIFIHGINNVSYGLSFFVTRFREAFFHFSTLYDMVETTIPRENPERMLIERDFFGREALNVIACEGSERVERAETYKQWRVRHLKAGFVQIPFDRELMDSAMYKVRKFYHKDFLVDEVNLWLLMGWKGKITHAMSCWQPV